MIWCVFFRLARTWGMLAPVLALAFGLNCDLSFAQQNRKLKTLDDQFADVAKRAPEFGGMFLGPNEQKLQVYLTNISKDKVDAVRRAIVAVFGAAAIPKGGIEALQGQYGFLQLNEWYTRIQASIWSTPGITFTDIDEAKNRLAIGVEQPEGEARVIEQLGRLGVPREAVVIQVTGPIQPLSHSLGMPNSNAAWPYLWDAGYVISRILCNSSGGLARGTAGFNVTGAFGLGFITNSHNTAARWNLDTNLGFPAATIYRASAAYPAQVVGKEIADPQGFTGSPCPAGVKCRYSDSALIRYNSDVKFGRGRIGRTTAITTSAASAVLTIDHSGIPSGAFGIISRPTMAYFVGVPLNKVGMRTGWTSGRISTTNATFPATGLTASLICSGGLLDPTQAPAGSLYLSQYVVSDTANDVVEVGDSGSPVFRKPSNSNWVELYGILWGKYANNNKSFIFSPVDNVLVDHGLPFSYCIPGANC